MHDWTAEELDRIGAAEELEIAVHRRARTGEPIQTFLRRRIRESACGATPRRT